MWEEFISYCYYPAKGQRSFGPMRAQLVYGSDYHQKANDEVVSMAMIETKEAVENIDDILSVPDLTGIYIGPADLSSSYGLSPKFDNREDIIFNKIQMIVKKTKESGKIAGIHNGTTKYAKEMLNLGYQFVTISSDFRSMSSHAQSIVDDMKNIDSKKNIVY